MSLLQGITVTMDSVPATGACGRSIRPISCLSAPASLEIFCHPIYYPRTILALPPSSNSDPGSYSGPSFLLPTTVRAFIFIARRTQHFLPSSTRVELCSQQLILFLHFCKYSLISPRWESNSRTNASSIRG